MMDHREPGKCVEKADKYVEGFRLHSIVHISHFTTEEQLLSEYKVVPVQLADHQGIRKEGYV